MLLTANKVFLESVFHICSMYDTIHKSLTLLIAVSSFPRVMYSLLSKLLSVHLSMGAHMHISPFAALLSNSQDSAIVQACVPVAHDRPQSVV